MKAFEDFRKHPLISTVAVLVLGLVIGFGLYGFMNYIELGGTFTPNTQEVAKTNQATVLPPSQSEASTTESTVTTPTTESTTTVTVPAAGTTSQNNNSSNQSAVATEIQAAKPKNNPVACVPVVGPLLAPKNECKKEN